MKIFLALLISIVSATNVVAQKSEVYVKHNAAIDGYDVVAYFKVGKAVKGNKEYTFKWNEATWYFSTAENLEDFKQSPEMFAPQYGGYCAYGMSDEDGHKASTDPNAWTIVGGRLYFNYNINVKNMWQTDSLSRIKQANSNWLIQKNEE